jgi:hypothetical protein
VHSLSHFARDARRGRQLQHRRPLALAQTGDQHDLPVGELQGVEDVRDLMVAAVECRFGQVNRLPVTIEWLSDNGSCYVAGVGLDRVEDITIEDGRLRAGKDLTFMDERFERFICGALKLMINPPPSRSRSRLYLPRQGVRDLGR